MTVFAYKTVFKTNTNHAKKTRKEQSFSFSRPCTFINQIKDARKEIFFHLLCFQFIRILNSILINPSCLHSSIILLLLFASINRIYAMEVYFHFTFLISVVLSTRHKFNGRKKGKISFYIEITLTRISRSQSVGL